ncbi:MAG: MerR family transcriptional regulator [Candidatus Nomurabacteria bacterium]|jgi:DNA-binding transcriptional MerR regulator|nr:MerR family transcriptional regulator [Candidatus Nomurabacteria bacterium]
MKELLSIKEFSEVSGIESSTLRYWDNIGLFSPIERDLENNYRYYSPGQLIAVNFITVMASLGVSLKTISEIESNRNPENIMELIDHQEKLLDMRMRSLRESYSTIHTRRELIKRGLKVDVPKISVMTTPERAIILGPRTKFKKGELFYGPFIDFCNKADELRINLNYPIGGYHDNFETFSKAPGQPDYFYSLDPTGNHRLPAGEYLVGYLYGYYGEFGDLPAKMLAYAKENRLTLSGPLHTVYLHDEICVKDPSRYLVEVCVAVSKSRENE